MLIASSPATKLPAVGAAAGVELWYKLIGVKPEAAIFIPYKTLSLLLTVDWLVQILRHLCRVVLPLF